MQEREETQQYKFHGMQATSSEIKNWIERIIRVNMREQAANRSKYVGCIWGEAGLGKTSSIKQLAPTGIETLDGKLLKFNIIDIPIAQIEEMGDIHGVPEVIEVKQPDGSIRRVTTTAPPAWVPEADANGWCKDKGGIPDEDYGGTILLFDDWNRTDTRIIKGIMQLLQDYKTINWELPKDVHIFMTGNPDNATYMVNTLDPAILTRMLHITMKFDKIEWAKWATNAKVDKRVINFMLKYPEQAYGGERTNPRSWEQMARLIQDIPVLKDHPQLMTIIKSSLDDTVSAQFISFITSELDQLIDPEDLLEDYDKCRERLRSLVRGKGKDQVRTDILGILIDRMYVYLTQDDISIEKDGKIAKNFKKFILDDDIVKLDFMYTLCRRLRADLSNEQRNKNVANLITGDQRVAQRIMEIFNKYGEKS